MANYAPDKPGHTEAALTSRTPAGGSLTDTVTNDGLTMLAFVISSGGPYTVTITASTATAHKCSHGFSHDLTVTVPATATDVWIGPFPTDRFNDDDGRLTITWPATVTNMTFKALSCGGTVSGL